MSPIKQFLADIDAFLERSGMTATAFGQNAVGDGNFVGDVRAGRTPTLYLVEKVQAYIAKHKKRAPMKAAS